MGSMELPGSAVDPNRFESRVSGSAHNFLQSKKEKHLLDTIDEIRAYQIQHQIDLPQLVVCGDQSSGKSSVLEAISKIPFPRGENTCTRFVTEIQFRKSEPGSLPSIHVTIKWDKSRHGSQQTGVRSFSEKGGWNQLPAIAAEAQRAMGLHDDIANGPRFSKDILKVEIWHPDQQPLTLVDLPGLIQVDNHNGADVKMVTDIVDDYINNPRSIILAVISANIDAVNQAILRKAKLVDPQGRRTFGIITKPDLAGKGSDLGRSWINLAQNKDKFQFYKGWHVLLNRDFNELKGQTSSDIRDQNEKRFFCDASNEWSEIKADSWGINSLRDRLRRLLYDLTRSQLPSVQRDIVMKLSTYDVDLKELNAKIRSQKVLWETFRKKCNDIADMVEKGASGKIHNAFFDIDNPDDIRYLRSNIEKEYNSLYMAMKLKGRGISFPGFPVESDDVPAIDPQWVEKVWATLKRTRGEELLGQTDPQRLDHLFWAHSKPWFDIASEHIGKCFRHCERFISYVVESHLDREFPGLPTVLRTEVLRNALDARKELAEKELYQIEEDRKRSTKTRNKAFLDKSQQARNEKLFQFAQQAVHEDKRKGNMEMGLNARFIAKSLNKDEPHKTEREKAEELLREMLIYYNIARDVFVDNVLVQVIERHLLNEIDRDFREGMGIKEERFNQIWRDEQHDENVIKKENAQKERDSLRECLNKVESAMNFYS